MSAAGFLAVVSCVGGARGLATSMAVLGGAVLFGLLLRPAGRFVATAVLVAVGSFADDRARPGPVLGAAVLLATGASLVFGTLLGPSLPVLGSWFGG
jgi:hypothetical protein